MKKKILLLIAVATLGLTAATMAQVPSYVPTNGLVSAYVFSGNANNVYGNGTNGVVNNATLTTDRLGNANSAYSFNGTDCSIDLGINSEINGILTDFTFSYWVYNTNMSAGGGVLASYSIQDGSYWRFLSAIDVDSVVTGFMVGGGAGIWQGNSTTQQSVPLNIWSNITVVRNGINMSTYINSILSSSILVSSNSLNNPTNPYATTKIGCLFPNTPTIPWFNGKIDDIYFYNRALTQQEITDLYNGCQLSVTSQTTNQNVNINSNAQFIVATSDPLATYQWQTDLGVGFQNLNNGGQYSGTTNDTLTISNVTMSNNNQPFRCIINNGSCTDTSATAVLTVLNNTGINENAQNNLFSVFPNPAQSSLYVKADNKLIGSVFTIYDNIGKVVKSGKLNTANTTIELGNLSNGMYLFSIGDHKKQPFKIIKE